MTREGAVTQMNGDSSRAAPGQAGGSLEHADASAGAGPRIRIASFPRQQLNPYQQLFYQALRPFGIEVWEFSHVNDSLLTEFRPSILHFHWSLELIWRTRGEGLIERVRAVVGWWRFLARARAAGIRVIWTVHELHPEQETWLDRLGFLTLARHADLFITHSRACANELTRRFGTRSGRIMTIPIGTYEGVYPVPGPREAVLSRLGLDPSKPVLLCFGYMRPRKGLEVAIEAVKELGAQYQLLITGKPTNREAEAWLDRLRANAGLWPTIRFIPYKLTDQEFSDVVAAADCVLLPYTEINSSSALATAVAFGKGVVASDLPFFREWLVEEPAAGALVPPGDERALARAISEFFSFPAEPRREAASRLAAKWKWSAVVEPVGKWLVANGRPDEADGAAKS